MILVARAYAKTDVVKIGRKGKRVKMARWWGRLGGKTVTHVASPRLIVKLHEAASQSIVPNISAKRLKVNPKTW